VFSLPFGHIFMKHDVGRFGWDAECTGSHAHICWEFLCAARGHCANLCSSDFWPVFSYQFSSCFRFWESKFSVCVGTRWRCDTFFLFETCCFYVYIMRRTISMCISCDELIVYFYLFFMFSSSPVPGIAIALQTRSGKRQPWQERQQSKLQS